MLHRIHRTLAPEEKIIKPKRLPSLPLNDENAFSEFQKFLISDDNFYSVVDYFCTLMKVDEQTDKYTAVSHILPKLITNSLARMINYAGSGLVKLKFQNTKLHEAINCAVLKIFPESNLIQAERKISRWFHTSNQRKI
ncbi:DUF4806 domain-containing protein [Camponotus japonicus]